MKLCAFASRVTKELLRDPLTFAFGLAFPLLLLGLMTLIQSSVPVPLFELTSLTPGISVFGLSFFTLFSGSLLAKDRESALLARLSTTPMTTADFLLGYTLPLLPMASMQGCVCYLAALLLGLQPTLRLIPVILSLIPIALLYTSIGLIFGAILSVTQLGFICGGLFINLSAWVSGAWLDLDWMGRGFQCVANLLPFAHIVRLERGILSGEALNSLLPHMLWIVGYTLLTGVLAIGLFQRRVRRPS